MFIANTQLTTARAGLRSVSGVNIDNRDTCFEGFVFDKALQLTKSPGVGSLSLLSLDSDTLPDVFQVFQDQHVSGFTVGDNGFTNLVVNVFHPASLFARKTFQSAFGTLRSFALKTLAKVGVMLPDVHYLFSSKGLTLAGCCDVIKPPIDSNRVAARGYYDFLLQHYVDVEDFLTPIVRQRCCLWLLPFEKSKLEVANSQFDVLPSIMCGDTDFLFLLNISESPGIKRHTGGLEFSWSAFPLLGGRHSGNSTYNMVGLQLIFGFHIMIAQLVKLIPVGYFMLSGYFEDVVAAVSKTLERFLEDWSKLLIHLKFAFNCLYEFHITNYIMLLNICQAERRSGFLSRINAGVSAAGSL